LTIAHIWLEASPDVAANFLVVGFSQLDTPSPARHEDRQSSALSAAGVLPAPAD
jgi:hypothetical protein